jgi:hypothetical protein
VRHGPRAPLPQVRAEALEAARETRLQFLETAEQSSIFAGMAAVIGRRKWGS